MLFQTNLVGFGKCAGLSTVLSLSGPWGAKPHLAGTGGGFPPEEMCVPTVMFPCGSEGRGVGADADMEAGYGARNLQSLSFLWYCGWLI